MRSHYIGESFRDWLLAENLSLNSAACSSKADKKTCKALKSIRSHKSGEFTDSSGVKWTFSGGKVAGADPPSVLGNQKYRMFVGNAEAFYASGFGVATAGQKSAVATQVSSAGVEQMTVLAMKAFHENCSKLIIVNKPDAADYLMRLDRSNGKFKRLSAIAVFDRSGEMIFAGAGGLTKQAQSFCKQLK
jgi:hypothetical protein